MGAETLCGGLTLVILIISGVFIVLGLVGLVSLRLGVVGAYLVKGRPDRRESDEYGLSQSRPMADEERRGGPAAGAG